MKSIRQLVSLSMIVWALIIFLGGSQLSFGQINPGQSPVKFTVTVTPDTATVGDNITLEIEAEYPESIRLTPPANKIDEQKFALKAGPIIESKTNSGIKHDTYKFTLAAFETGIIQTPDFEYFYHDSSGAHSIVVPQKQILVKSLLPSDTTGLDVKDIVGPKALSTRWWVYILILGAVIILATAAYLLYKRKLRNIEIPQTPPEPPYDKAIRELVLLREKDLTGKGKIKPYYIELSEILRRYIEGRFEIKAVEATTYELKKMLKHPELPSNKAQESLLFLNRSDLVKFAKYVPEIDIAAADYEQIKNFVSSTKPAEIPMEAIS